MHVGAWVGGIFARGETCGKEQQGPGFARKQRLQNGKRATGRGRLRGKGDHKKAGVLLRGGGQRPCKAAPGTGAAPSPRDETLEKRECGGGQDRAHEHGLLQQIAGGARGGERKGGVEGQTGSGVRPPPSPAARPFPRGVAPVANLHREGDAKGRQIVGCQRPRATALARNSVVQAGRAQ